MPAYACCKYSADASVSNHQQRHQCHHRCLPGYIYNADVKPTHISISNAINAITLIIIIIIITMCTNKNPQILQILGLASSVHPTVGLLALSSCKLASLLNCYIYSLRLMTHIYSLMLILMMMMMNYDLVFTAANKKNVQKQMIILSTGQIAKDQEQHQRDVWTEFLGFLKQRAAKQVSNYYVAAYDNGDHDDDDGNHMMMVII